MLVDFFLTENIFSSDFWFSFPRKSSFLRRILGSALQNSNPSLTPLFQQSCQQQQQQFQGDGCIKDLFVFSTDTMKIKKWQQYWEPVQLNNKQRESNPQPCL